MISLRYKQRGFSLVETLVAISILLIVIVGPMTISMQSAKSSSFASEQVQAFFLAQEGLELAQKTRDDLLLDSATVFGGSETSPWNQFSTNAGPYDHCLAATGCGLSWDGNDPENLATVADCSVSGDCKLYLNTATSSVERAHFSHDGSGTPIETLFTRRVYFTPSGNDAIQVRSEVTWRTGSLVEEQKVEVDTYLYNIYDTP